MKKRIRKKLHLREFEKFGLLISLNAKEEQMDEVIDRINDFADAHGLYSWGGGYGRFSMQHVKNSYVMPNTIVDIIRIIISGANEKPIFCIYSPKAQYVSDEEKKELESIFANDPDELQVAVKQINLWH